MAHLQTSFKPVACTPHIADQGASRIAYRVGGLSFGMFAEDGLQLKLDPILYDFSVFPSECDINITVTLVDKLHVPVGFPLFHSGGLWSLFKEDAGVRLNFQRSFPGEAPYKSAWFDRGFKTGHLQLSRDFFSSSWPVYPLEYPLDEVLMIHRLACGEGVEVHAVGIVDADGRGHLFMGHSGAGKSTTARLWRKQQGTHILSDDRIILRMHNGKLWMFGTPWHGDAGIASPDSAPLTDIYVLEQGSKNEILPLQGGLASAELFARSFVPRHCPESLEFSLGFLQHVAQSIPCNTFRFVPDQTAVETIRRA
ncbi:MAG TPA: hypothetical protein VK525_18885 [Candidatus Saccharimonadales bacterium]|nr:hypothetical protein [Candidatus Saccharimonadales bacterium]